MAHSEKPRSVAIAMPLFNEAQNIERTLVELSLLLSQRAYEPLFVIQNDASTDSSLQVVQALSLFSEGKIKVETNPINVGHGPTVGRAYRRALETGQDLILHLDSDGDLDFKSVIDCVDTLCEGHFDAVIGSRIGRTEPAYRRFVTRTLRFALLTLFGVASRDVNSPVRVYRREALTKLLRACPAESVIIHVLLTIITHKFGNFRYQTVTTKLQPHPALGSSWRSSRRFLGVPTRFIRLVVQSAVELISFRLSLRHRVQLLRFGHSP